MEIVKRAIKTGRVLKEAVMHGCMNLGFHAVYIIFTFLLVGFGRASLL
jgi:hypothetical protein